MGRQFQPDQQAMVICMIDSCARDDKSIQDRKQNIVEKAAEGLVRVWNGSCFSLATSDIWERRHNFPESGGNHIYTLAACARALHIAHGMTGKPEYKDVAEQMAKILWDDARGRGYLIRTIGTLEDPTPDVAQLGVFWPFDMEEDDGTVRSNTLEMIEKACVEDYRVFRFPGDIYDGWVTGSTNRNQGAGYWPLLNFWMSIVLHRAGRQEEAKKYFTRVLQDTGDYIPEQIFGNVIQQGVSPLAWSHAMFVLAAKELGYLEKEIIELEESARILEKTGL